MSSTASSDAKRVWDEMNSRAETSQALVGGDWLASDTSARVCGTGGVQWAVSRIGPGTSADDRVSVADKVESQWRELGWKPVRSELTGDAPGLQLRYPGAGTFEDGFYVEFATTEHGSTIALQTPCTPGDVDSLNREKYAEKHTNTPPDVPGASSTGATP